MALETWEAISQNPNPLVAFQWWLNGDDFGKLGEEMNREVGC